MVVKSFLTLVTAGAMIIAAVQINDIYNDRYNKDDLKIDKMTEKIKTMNDEEFIYSNFVEYLSEKGIFFLLDGEGHILYTNNELKYSDFLKSELEYLAEYGTDTKQHVVKYKTDSGDNRYLFFLGMNDNKGVETIESYFVTDDSLNLIRSSQESEKTVLTKKEVEYFKGISEGNMDIWKYSYKNKNNQSRILVFCGRNDEGVSGRSMKIKSLLFIAVLICLYIALAVIIIKKLLKKINLMMIPLKLILEENDMEGEFVGEKNPNENLFDEIAQRYKVLNQKLEHGEWKRKFLEQDKKQFAASISHDLRNPLNAIQNYVRALSMGIISEEEKEAYSEAILKKIEGLVEMVEYFHKYNIIEHPNNNANFDKKDVCVVIQNCLADKYEEIEMEGFLVEADIPEESILCNVDSVLFTRALENLINNSLKYNEKGTKLFVKVEKTEKNALIYIGDDGIGIPAAMKENMFKPFVAEKKDYKNIMNSSGLGLYIVKSIVDMHKGRIKILNTSVHGCSTEFVITLPLVSN